MKTLRADLSPTSPTGAEIMYLKQLPYGIPHMVIPAMPIPCDKSVSLYAGIVAILSRPRELSELWRSGAKSTLLIDLPASYRESWKTSRSLVRKVAKRLSHSYPDDLRLFRP